MAINYIWTQKCTVYFMSYHQRCVFTKVIINVKLWAVWTIFFPFQVRAPRCILTLSVLDEEVTLRMSEVPFLLNPYRTNVAVKLRTMGIHPKWGCGLATLSGETFMPWLKKFCYVHQQLLAKQILSKEGW